MRLLLDALDCGLLLLDSRGRVEQVNRWMQDRCASAPRLGAPLADAFGAAVETRLLAAVQACLDQGNAVRLSQAFHPTPLPLLAPGATAEEGADRLRQAVDVVPVEDPETGARSCLVQVRDVSDTVRREQTLRQRKQLGRLRLVEAQQQLHRLDLHALARVQLDLQRGIGLGKDAAAYRLAAVVIHPKHGARLCGRPTWQPAISDYATKAGSSRRSRRSACWPRRTSSPACSTAAT